MLSCRSSHSLRPSCHSPPPIHSFLTPLSTPLPSPFHTLIYHIFSWTSLLQSSHHLFLFSFILRSTLHPLTLYLNAQSDNLSIISLLRPFLTHPSFHCVYSFCSYPFTPYIFSPFARPSTQSTFSYAYSATFPFLPFFVYHLFLFSLSCRSTPFHSTALSAHSSLLISCIFHFSSFPLLSITCCTSSIPL